MHYVGDTRCTAKVFSVSSVWNFEKFCLVLLLIKQQIENWIFNLVNYLLNISFIFQKRVEEKYETLICAVVLYYIQK